MKYFLALDRGSFRSSTDRYKILDLSSINPELNKNDNLKSLVKFSTTFETKKELKDLLLAKGIISSNASMYDLVIYYELSYPRTIEIAYKCDEEYLDIGRLSDIIYDKLKNKDFYDAFISRYETNSLYSDEVGLIKEYATDMYANHRYYDAIRKLINKICYKQKPNGKTDLNYKQLYDLGLFVSKLANKGRSIIINRVNKQTLNNVSRIPKEGTAEYDKMEEWQERLKTTEDDQMKLF